VPQNIQAGQTGAELSIIVANTGNEVVSVQGIVISMPADDTSPPTPYLSSTNLLASASNSIQASISSSDHTAWLVSPTTGGGDFTFTPADGSPVSMETQALTITFTQIPVGVIQGPGQITINESASESAGATVTGSSEDPPPITGSTTLSVLKGPSVFGLSSFVASSAQANPGDSVTLSWVASAGTYSISYSGVTINEPSNEPGTPLPDCGSYVIQDLQDTTVFTFIAVDPSSDNVQEMQFTVTVIQPPQINLFTAEPVPSSQGLGIQLNWGTQNADFCTLNNDNTHELETGTATSGYVVGTSQILPQYQLSAFLNVGAVPRISQAALYASSWENVQTCQIPGFTGTLSYVSTDGSTLYVITPTGNLKQAITAYGIDSSGALGQQTAQWAVAISGGIAIAVALSPDGALLYVGAASFGAAGYLQVIDASNGAVCSTLSIPGPTLGVAASSDGSRVYVLAADQNAEYDGSGNYLISLTTFSTTADSSNPLQLLNTIQVVAPAGGTISSIAFANGPVLSADGTQLFVGLQGGIAVFATADLEQSSPSQTTVLMGSPDDGAVYPALSNGYPYLVALQGDLVSLLDPSTLTSSIPPFSVGPHAQGVAIVVPPSPTSPPAQDVALNGGLIVVWSDTGLLSFYMPDSFSLVAS
jgi:hypothetical protein